MVDVVLGGGRRDREKGEKVFTNEIPRRQGVYRSCARNDPTAQRYSLGEVLTGFAKVPNPRQIHIQKN